jgi:dimethylhistidine N-methyltransferase
MSTSHSLASDIESSPLAYFLDLEPPQDDFLQDTLDGLSQPQKKLLPKYFYDKAGSALFDQICRTEEYYVTRTELALLKSKGPEISELSGDGCRVIEYGSGSSIKIRILLDALEKPSEYVAVDISREHLCGAAVSIAEDYPDIKVGAICADFTVPIDALDEILLDEDSWLGFFPGSTIGNFDPAAARRLLEAYRQFLSPDGHLLIGVDLKKDRDTLTAAYNDDEGITAAFNKNILRRMCRELGASVDVDAYEHCAFYNEQDGRVEMYLKSKRDQAISLNGHEFLITKDETIHTESSYKYHVDEFISLVEQTGFRSRAVWIDDHNRFSLHFLSVVI